MENIKAILGNKLINTNRFWSNKVNDVSEIPDDILIEKTLVYLDIEDIKLLFKLYSQKKLKQVWKERLLLQNDYYKSLNRFLAWMYFEVKDPDKYIKRVIRDHYKKLRC